MAFLTSPFLPPAQGDRPEVVPTQTVNDGFIGQFVELADDVVFTVEYSIRSAHAAPSGLCGLTQTPPPVYKRASHPRVLLHAFAALHDPADRTPEPVRDAVRILVSIRRADHSLCTASEHA